jgi:hypothetical protein
MRSSTVLFAVISVVVGVILFRVKYEVDHLAYEHKMITKNIRNTEETIHVLKAEWAHLNDPERIHRLVVKYLPNNNTQSIIQNINKKELTPSQDIKKDVVVADVFFEEKDAFEIFLEEDNVKKQSVRSVHYQKKGGGRE